jgi:putative membrane protein
MTTWKLLTITWSVDPSILAGSALVLAGFVWIVRKRWTRRAWLFIAGILVFVFALECPLDKIGDTYLFSAHMAQHLFLLWIVPPLVILGTPRWLAQWIKDQPVFGRTEQILSNPFVAWPTGVVTLWAWHTPLLYNAALADETIHAIEHLSFTVSATIFWWPVLEPTTEDRLAPLAAVAYIWLGGAMNTLLALILALMPVGYYPEYVHPVDTYGALSLIRNTWGISAQEDQQIGALLMFVGGGFLFLAGIIHALHRWYSMPEDDIPLLLSEGVQRIKEEKNGAKERGTTQADRVHA